VSFTNRTRHTVGDTCLPLAWNWLWVWVFFISLLKTNPSVGRSIDRSVGRSSLLVPVLLSA
jgi:hypothetical protein